MTVSVPQRKLCVARYGIKTFQKSFYGLDDNKKSTI